MTGADILTVPALAAAGAAGLGWWKAVVRSQGLFQKSQELEEQLRALKENLATLEEAATHDRLTGAWNRRRFEEAAHAEMSLARRRRAPVSLIMLDLDHFKRVNDTHGHAAGDRVLAGATATFRQALRSSDALTRWGGEEFLVLSPATPLDGAVNLAERIRAGLEASPFPDIGRVTLSAGVAEYQEGESLETWVDRADQALYRAKAEGRNRVAASAMRSPAFISGSAGLLELVWEEAYASGHRFIDAQHQQLFHLSNALLTSLVEGAPVSVVEQRMETLLSHTSQHFQDEECLLQDASYPDLDEHRREHARLLASARSLRDELKTGRIDFGRLVVYLVTDLVKGHILSEDCHYFSHLLAAAPDSEA